VNPTLITGPASEAVTLAELKAHLRILHADEDVLIQSLGTAATAYLDGWKGILGRAIMLQTWRDEFPGWGCLRLSLPDVSGVVVSYVDAAGDSFPAAEFEVFGDAMGAYVEASGPSAKVVYVEYTCGLPVAQLALIKVAIKMLVAHWYENRSGAAQAGLAEVPLAFSAMITPLRWVSP